MSNKVRITRHPDSKRLYVHLQNAPGKRPVKMSLRTTSHAAAKRLVKDANLVKIQQTAQADALNGEAITRLRVGKKLHIDTAVKDFLEYLPLNGGRENTIDFTRDTLNRWMREMKIERLALAALEESHFSKFVNARGEQKYATRNRVLVVLRGFAKFCVNRGWLATNPALEVVVNVDKLSQAQLTEDETPPLTEDEIKKILRATGPEEFWHAATLIGWHTGLRLFNVATMEWTNVHEDHVVAFTHKGKSTVKVPMTPELKALFARLPRTDSNYLFPAQAASIILGGPSSLSQQFRRLCIRLDIHGKSFNGLRHSYALRTMEGVSEKKLKLLADLLGVDSLNDLRKLMGHAKANVTLRYLNHPKAGQ